MSPLTISVQPTPNVNALKFVLDRRLTEGKSRTFRSVEEAVGEPLAQSLLRIPGVVQVFFLNDFITVTRAADIAWEQLADQVEEAIQAYFASR